MTIACRAGFNFGSGRNVKQWKDDAHPHRFSITLQGEHSIMEDMTEELAVQCISPRIPREGLSPPQLLGTEVERRFQFHLCRKQAVFGDLQVDHWWMPTNTLYGQRNRSAGNQQVVIEYWWALCTQNTTIDQKPVQESYILAKILPYARSNGSRKVFVDSVPTRPQNRKERDQAAAELNERLAAARTGEMNRIEFRDQTAELLGPPNYPAEIQERYEQIAEELLQEGRDALQRQGSPGLELTLAHWQTWMNSVGRHRGHAVDKQVLDVLSYECRTALHRCYSAVWCGLVPLLAQKHGYNKEWVGFHSLWHLDQSEESNRREAANFHMFHGHIFALHPACGTFLCTRTGTELLGDWLKTHGEEGPARRLVHGLYIAISHYAERNQIQTFLRKKEGHFPTISDMVALEERITEQRSGRRRPRKRKADAD
jgi:hypothetical protein